MNKNILWFKLAMPLAAAILFAGCGEPDPAAPPEDPAEVPETAAPPADEAEEIVITGNDMMEFDVTEFTVQAGSEVTITFRNIGQMPVEAMGHNLAILTLGTDPIEFANTSQAHPQNDYIDPAKEDQVIAATAILGPGEEETLEFTAPDESGDYPFVCSFPGHTQAGMRGVMIVE